MSALNAAAKTVGDTVEAPLKAAKTIGGWIKAHPVVFALLLLVVALIVLRYAGTVRGWIAKIPVIGPRLMGMSEDRTPGAG